MALSHAQQLEYCTFCPKMCRHACPVSNAIGSETLIPQSKMALMNLLTKNTIDWRPDYAHALFACTDCKRCQTYCNHGNDVSAVLTTGRATAQLRQMAPAALSDIEARWRRHSDELVTQRNATTPPNRHKSAAKTAYFPACDALTTDPNHIEKALRVFDALSLSDVVIADIPTGCGGYPLHAAGKETTTLKSQLTPTFSQFEKLVFGCPACLSFWQPHLASAVHLTTFLQTAADPSATNFHRRKPAVFYHDSCFLGRHLNEYDAPRALTQQCADQTHEFFHHHNEAVCCGAGGLVPIAFPQVTRTQSQQIIDEAQHAAIESPVIVTGCSSCQRALSAAATHADQPPVEIFGIIDLLNWSLG